MSEQIDRVINLSNWNIHWQTWVLMIWALKFFHIFNSSLETHSKHIVQRGNLSHTTHHDFWIGFYYCVKHEFAKIWTRFHHIVFEKLFFMFILIEIKYPSPLDPILSSRSSLYSNCIAIHRDCKSYEIARLYHKSYLVAWVRYTLIFYHPFATHCSDWIYFT